MALPLRGRFQGARSPAFVPASPAEAAQLLTAPPVAAGLGLTPLPAPGDGLLRQADVQCRLASACGQLAAACTRPTSDGAAAAWQALEAATALAALEQHELAGACCLRRRLL